MPTAIKHDLRASETPMTMNHRPIERCVVLATSLLLLPLVQAGCTPTYVMGGRLDDPSDVTTQGVRYHLGRDIVVVTVTITELRTRNLTDDPNAPLGPEELDRTTTGVVSVETVADLSETYLLAMTPGGTADSTIDFGVSPAGLPTSINVTAADRSAEVLGNVLEFAARIAGAVAGVPSVGIGRLDVAMAPPARGALSTQEIAARPAATALKTLRRYEQLLILAEADRSRRATELDAYRLSTPGDAQGIAARELALRNALALEAELEKERTAALERFAKAVAAAQSVGAFGPTRRSRTVRFVIPVEELPTARDGQRGTEAQHLFDATGIVVVSEPFGAALPGPLGAGQVIAVAAPQHDASCERPPVRLYFRPTEPWRISVWAVDPTWTAVQVSNAANAKSLNAEPTGGLGPHLQLVSQQVFNVLRPDVSPLMIEFEAAAFSTQSITVGYDANGRLTSMKRTGTSSVAGFAAGLAKGTAAAQDAFADGSSLEATRLKNEQAALEAKVEIEKLRRELEELKEKP